MRGGSKVVYHITAVAASVLWCVTANAGGPLRPFKDGFWSGGAYFDDRSGAFTHCSVGAAYDSGINLFVLVTRDYHWWLGFINPKWSLTPTTRASIQLRLDAGAPLNTIATIPSGQLLLVPLPDSPHLVDEFRRSSTLAIVSEGRSFSFRLNDTSAVMGQLTDCVRTSLALAAHLPPGGPLSTASETKPAPSVEAGSSAAAAPSGAPSTNIPGPAATPPQPTTGKAAAPQPPASAGGSPTTLLTAAVSTSTPTRTATAASPAPQQSAPATAVQSAALGTVSVAEPPAHIPASTPSAGTTVAPTASTAPLAGASNEAPAKTTEAISMESAQPAPPNAADSGVAALTTSPHPAAPDAASAMPATFPNLAATPRSVLPPPSTSPIAIEEVRLATDFIKKAGLPDARLVDANKPPELAGFAAVWRSENAAGAVKIIPPRPDASAIGIASDLIAVDPQMCRGNFSSARSRTNVDDNVVYSAVLSCSGAHEQRITEYFITPRRRGGFVVFAIIRRRAVEGMADLDWRNIDMLSRAAIEAAAGQG